MNENKNVPELRFPGFDGAWEKKRLGDITVRKTAKNKDERINQVFTNSATQGVVSQTDYFDKDIANQNNLGGYYIVDTDDFVYNPRISNAAPVGPIKRNHLGQGVMSPLYTVFSFTEGNNDFFEMYFETIYWHAYMNSIANFGARHDRMNITGADFQSMPLPWPSLEEQQKIADFLSAVDKKIEQLNEKHRLLTEYKKGVMQQIFSQQIRFKDDEGNEYPEWEEKRLGDLGSFKSGTGFPDAEQGGSNGVPFYKVSDMNLPSNERSMSVANNYVSDEQVMRLKFKVIDLPSIIFAKVGAAIFLERKREAVNFLIDNNMMAFTPIENISFFRHLFSILRLSKFAQVGALPSYNASDLKIIKVNLPCIEEQQKIADFLTAIDNKIDQAWSKLEQTKAFKKALLQKMFVS